jgi:hypothetical protein
MKVITYLMKVITYLMKVINVPDEGYYVPDEGYYVPDEGYFKHASWSQLNSISTFLLIMKLSIRCSPTSSEYTSLLIPYLSPKI